MQELHDLKHAVVTPSRPPLTMVRTGTDRVPIMPPDDSGDVPRRKPKEGATGWKVLEVVPEWTCWYHEPSGSTVLSSVHTPDPDIGPEWHVSISTRGKRSGRGVVAILCRDFEMPADGEDNHVAEGTGRHFWLAVNKDKAAPCPCRDNEPAIETPIPGDAEDADVFVFREEPTK